VLLPVSYWGMGEAPPFGSGPDKITCRFHRTQHEFR